jgi:Zn-dependent peptidase ImmA (M78 family)
VARARTLKAREAAQTLLREHGLAGPPVKLERLAKALKVVIQYQAFGGDLSGVSFVKNGVPVIGVNALHHVNRQRFTIAHELAHIVLHRDELTSEVHVLNRDAVTETGTDPFEVEANAFASELLMPEAWIRAEAGPRWDVHDDELITRLAKRFGVSTLALQNRLSGLTG